MSNMSEAIDNANKQISDAFNAAAKASWEAGFRTGLEQALACAQTIRDKATTPQGRGAAEAIMASITRVKDGQ